MPNLAANQYVSCRTDFHEANVALAGANLAPAISQLLFVAMRKWARAKFRGISGGLTNRKGVSFATTDGCVSRGVVEHAVPLRQIHNRLLGIDPNRPNYVPVLPHAYPAVEHVEAFVSSFVVGVYVTQAEHTVLNQLHAQDMPPEFQWDAGGVGLEGLMGRYVAAGIPFHPIGGCPHCA